MRCPHPMLAVGSDLGVGTRLVQIPLEIVKPKNDYTADSLVFDENHLNFFTGM